jgi:hypothetical protein
MKTSSDDASVRRDSIAIVVALSVVYVLLRSPIYIGDAVRWLPTVTASEAPTEGGGARHYFFTWFAWGAYHIGNALGLAQSNGPVHTGAVAVVQGVNAVLAAATVAITYRWLRLSVAREAALVGAAFVAFPSAFVLHATNMTEPVSSLVPAMLGVYLASKTPERRATRVVSGLLVGFATTLYLIAAVTVVPAAWNAAMRGVRGDRVPVWKRLRAAAEHAAPAGLAYAGIIALTELLVHPERGLLAALRHPFDFGLYGIYGELKLRSLAGALFGFANSLYPFPPSEGMSRLFRLPPAQVALILVVFALAMALLAGMAIRFYLQRRALKESGRWIDVAGGVFWFAAVYAVAVYFLPGYDKFWLFSSFAVASWVSLSVDGARFPRPSTSGRFRALVVVLPGLVLLAANVLFAAIPRRLTLNRDMVAAVSLASRIKPNDLLVCRGWDGPSGYLRYALKRPIDCFSLVDRTLLLGRKPELVAEAIAKQERAARASGGRVFFLGVLETTPETWGLFFGSQLGLPYEMFDAYRKAAVAIADRDLAAVNVALFEVP